MYKIDKEIKTKLTEKEIKKKLYIQMKMDKINQLLKKLLCL